MIQNLRMNVEDLLYPMLRPYSRSDRDRLLAKAKETPLDNFEWMGVLGALAFVALLTRLSSGGLGAFERVATGLANFVACLVLLGITAGPFLVRRTRRGLRSLLP
jgi:hypothetical protein